MNAIYLRFGCLALLLTVALAHSSLLYGQNKKPAGGSVNLSYDLPAGKPMAYSINSVITQQMDVEGQVVSVLVNNKLAYKVKQTGNQNGTLFLEITVDTLNISVETMGASTGGNISEVSGKTFNMTMAPSGKVIDVSGAEKVMYSVDGQSGGNLGQTFRDIFPNLPARQVRVGEEWSEKDTVINQTAGAEVFQVFESVNRYDGNETINGIPCAKITSSLKGTMETTTQNSGMDIFIKGPVSGQSTFYIAVGGGYVVRQEVKSRLNGTIEISGPASMSFPVVMDTFTSMNLK